MKQTIKFVVAVFGVTVATFGTMSSKAAQSIRCTGATGMCAQVETRNMTTGVITIRTLSGERSTTDQQ